MIYVGIDDTDTLDTPGTNQLARALVRHVAGHYHCTLIVRHQLLDDPRVPYTSHNGSASIGLVPPQGPGSIESLIDQLRAVMREWFVPGSDPGLCVAEVVPPAVIEFGRRCQRDLVEQQHARDLAARHGLYLEGLGGTEGGVIGALAAVGLAAGGNDGRIVQIAQWPDDLTGPQEIGRLDERGVEVRCLESEKVVRSGLIDVGKHLRPNYRQRKIVLFVQPAETSLPSQWMAVRLK
ncbi:MAG: hypothetical protein ACYC4U_30190 [Pirellulaceae bacterium]